MKLRVRLVLLVVVFASPMAGRLAHAEDVPGYHRDFTVGLHANLPAFTSGNARQYLAEVTRLVSKVQNHGGCPGDQTVCISLAAGSVGAYGSGTAIKTFANEDSVLAYLNRFPPPNYPEIKVVESITVGGVPYGGLTVGSQFNCIVAVYKGGDLTLPDTWAHEFGHMCSLEHDPAGVCGYNIMRDAASTVYYRDNLVETQIGHIEGALYLFGTPATVPCDPTADAWLGDILAVSAAAGVEISFTTQWESNTESFEVQRFDPTTESVIYSVGTATPGSSGNRRKYSISDPTGQAGFWYRIVEHQTGSLGDLITDPILAGPLPPPGAWASEYDADSLDAVVATYYDETAAPLPPPPLPPMCSGPQPEYLLMCPDSFMTALGSYASLWCNRGVSTAIRPLSVADSCFGGYEAYIDFAARNGSKYFLLVGDANDGVMWDDSTKWVNGWRYPRVPYFDFGSGTLYWLDHIPSQTGNNIIPTFYFPTASPVPPQPALSWTVFTPYYASDLPYSDIDNDSLPDVVVGRLPVSNTDEIRDYTAKLGTWLANVGGDFTRRAALFTQATDQSFLVAWPTAFARDSLRSLMSPALWFLEGTLTPWEPSPPVSSSYLQTLDSNVNAAASGAMDLVVWNINTSDRYTYGRWWRVNQTYPDPPIGSNLRPFVSIALSCGMNNFDETEDWNIGGTGTAGPFTFADPRLPLVERLLLNPGKGAIAQIGPTRGSLGVGNAMFGEELLKRIYEPGNSLGRAFLLAQRAMIQKAPEYRDLFKSYTILGDPRLGASVVTGVESGHIAERVRLLKPRPNPFNPSTVLSFFLEREGRASLVVLDVHGRVVNTLLERWLPRGWHDVEWNGRTSSGTWCASGIYFASLRANGTARIERLVFLK